MVAPSAHLLLHFARLLQLHYIPALFLTWERWSYDWLGFGSSWRWRTNFEPQRHDGVEAEVRLPEPNKEGLAVSNNSTTAATET